MSSCYTVSTEKANYLQAQANCLADNATLLSIGSSKKLLQVRKEMKRRERESHWWVGLRKNKSSSNTWKWLEEPPSSTPLVILWDLNQPDNFRIENCAEMFASGFMNDLECSSSRPYICEKHLNHTRDLKNCETGWILISSSCYKLYIEEMEWSDAQASCKKDGADMLSINSIDELHSLPLG
ncbi:lymphocyte antigen 75-like [Pomacea canaliculata]|uniref:lymphocyte antigen 75-like n=1 Tax=Pomacea canaliculata TaxID=400727 RepID=UPI000D72D8D8|nr:lymphocyte antigen 75-like [Pomacea canaliculata]